MQTVAGVLLERGTDRAVEGGLVSLLSLTGDSIASALTGADGAFAVTAPTGGDYLLAAAAWGYEATVASSVFTLEEGGVIEVEFRIPPAALEVEGLSVRAVPALFSQHPLVTNGFVERAALGVGLFLGPREIEDARVRTTLELLRTTGRLTVAERAEGTRLLMRNRSGLCAPLIYLDGVPTVRGDVSLDALVPLAMVEGIEIYRSGAEAPQQYAPRTELCGVILIWTRFRGV